MIDNCDMIHQGFSKNVSMPTVERRQHITLLIGSNIIHGVKPETNNFDIGRHCQRHNDFSSNVIVSLSMIALK